MLYLEPKRVHAQGDLPPKQVTCSLPWCP